MRFRGIESVGARYTSDMTIARGLFYVASVFLAGVILFACYILYRHVQTPNGADVVRMFQQRNVATIPPTSCSYTRSNFEGTDKGALFINKGNILLETATVKGNASGQLRVVISPDGTYTVDPTTSGVIVGGGNQKEAIDSRITTASWTCSPWWFPDEALFNVSE